MNWSGFKCRDLNSYGTITTLH